MLIDRQLGFTFAGTLHMLQLVWELQDLRVHLLTLLGQEVKQRGVLICRFCVSELRGERGKGGEESEENREKDEEQRNREKERGKEGNEKRKERGGRVGWGRVEEGQSMCSSHLLFFFFFWSRLGG